MATENNKAMKQAAQTELEAFEQWYEGSGFEKFKDTAFAAWQARASLPALQRGIASNNPTPSRFGSPDLQALIVQHATQQAAPEPEFDDCPESPTGKHSESWFGNGDCDHCKTGDQNAPMAITTFVLEKF